MKIHRQKGIKMIENERGMILLTVLIIMFIAALLGTVALNNANIEVQLSGNERRVSTARAGAEAGADLAKVVIETTRDNGALPVGNMIVDGNTVAVDSALLDDEILDPAYSRNADYINSEITGTYAPDLGISNLGGIKVEVDIDRLHSEVIAGGALEFAMGYEGVGAGAAGGGIAIFYRINSAGTK